MAPTDYLITRLTDPTPLDPATLPDGDGVSPTDSPAAAAALGELEVVLAYNDEPGGEYARLLADYRLTPALLGGRDPEAAWARLAAAGIGGLNDEWCEVEDGALVVSLRVWLLDSTTGDRRCSLPELLAELHTVAADVRRVLTT